MSITHLLEDFEIHLNPGSRRRVFSDVQLEELRLSSFETGYTAGWDDAVKSLGETQVRVAEGLEKRIEDIQFTYVEALAAMLAATEPVFRAILDQLLPSTTDPVLAGTLLDELNVLAREAGDAGLVLTVPVGSSDYVGRAVGNTPAVPVKIVEDSAFPPDRAAIKLAAEEHEIDLAGFAAAMRETIEAALFEITEDQKYG